MSNYQQGYDDARSEQYAGQVGRGVGTLIGWGLLLGSRLFIEVLVASPFLLVGFMLLSPLAVLGPTLGLIRMVSVGSLAYFLYAALYWLKGVVVALSHRGGWLWLVPFVPCVAITCFVPGWLVRQCVISWFPTAGPLWGWGLGVAFALFAYSRYRFTEHSAPDLVDWSYSRGYRWAKK